MVSAAPLPSFECSVPVSIATIQQVSKAEGVIFCVRRCALLLADTEGGLRLADLRRGEPDQARSFPVRGLPRLLAVHEHSRTLGMIIDMPTSHSVLRCVRPGRDAGGASARCTPHLHAPWEAGL